MKSEGRGVGGGVTRRRVNHPLNGHDVPGRGNDDDNADGDLPIFCHAC